MSPFAVLAGALLLILAAGAVVAGWLRRHLLVATVRGASMEPAFRAGERVLVRRRRLAQVGHRDVVVVRPPGVRLVNDEPAEREWILKRAAALPGDPVPEDVPSSGLTVVPDGALVALGDNRAASTDSRHHGFYFSDQLVGVVVRKVSPRDRSSRTTSQS